MSEQLSVERLLERFAGGGWDALATSVADLSKPGSDQAQMAYDRICQAAARMAASDDGRLVLDWLVDLTLRKASWHGQLGMSVEQIATYGLLREGQNSLVALLLGAILKGQGGAPLSRDVGA